MRSVGRPGTTGLSAHTTGCPAPSIRSTTGQPRRVSSVRSHSAARRVVGFVGGQRAHARDGQKVGKLLEQPRLLAIDEGEIHGDAPGLRVGGRDRAGKVYVADAKDARAREPSHGGARLSGLASRVTRLRVTRHAHGQEEGCDSESALAGSSDSCRDGGRRRHGAAQALRGDRTAGVQRHGAGHSMVPPARRCDSLPTAPSDRRPRWTRAAADSTPGRRPAPVVTLSVAKGRHARALGPLHFVQGDKGVCRSGGSPTAAPAARRRCRLGALHQAPQRAHALAHVSAVPLEPPVEEIQPRAIDAWRR